MKVSKFRKKAKELVIEIGSNGPRFLGEHNMVHTPTLNFYIDQLLKLYQDYNDEVIGMIIKMIASDKYSHNVELTDAMVSNAFLNLNGKNANIVKFDKFEFVDDLTKLRAGEAK